MTDNIEQKALALVNEVRAEYGGHPNGIIAKNTYAWDALCRAIEQHEAFRQEVSDALEQYFGGSKFVRSELLNRFIIAKHDPLVEAIREMALTDATPEDADRLRAALAARGLEIREKQP